MCMHAHACGLLPVRKHLRMVEWQPSYILQGPQHWHSGQLPTLSTSSVPTSGSPPGVATLIFCKGFPDHCSPIPIGPLDKCFVSSINVVTMSFSDLMFYWSVQGTDMPMWMGPLFSLFRGSSGDIWKAVVQLTWKRSHSRNAVILHKELKKRLEDVLFYTHTITFWTVSSMLTRQWIIHLSYIFRIRLEFMSINN